MKPTTVKQFIRNAVDLGVADLVDLIRAEAKGKERIELLHYLHNYADRASNPAAGGIKKTVRRAKRKG